jgi:hypothetical protein
MPKWVRWLLYPAFWTLLLIPLLRRWRRQEGWNRIRFTLALAGIALLGLALGVGPSWLGFPGVVLALGAFALPAAADPERERKLQRRHGADYLLNGGRWEAGNMGGSPPLSPGTPVYLLLRGQEILVVPSLGAGEVHSTIETRQIGEILVGGQPYHPVYVSEAKDPPVKEESVDQSATTVLELVTRAQPLRFRYAGPFRKHLADTAAHAIYSARKLAADGVAGQSPEVFHIIGR